jgi:hypothetical protein
MLGTGSLEEQDAMSEGLHEKQQMRKKTRKNQQQQRVKKTRKTMMLK